MLTRLTGASDGYRLYREVRRATQEAGEPIRVRFLETEVSYEWSGGHLRVTTVWDNGAQREVRVYDRTD